MEGEEGVFCGAFGACEEGSETAWGSVGLQVV